MFYSIVYLLIMANLGDFNTGYWKLVSSVEADNYLLALEKLLNIVVKSS